MKNLYLIVLLTIAALMSSCGTSKDTQAQQVEMKQLNADLRDAQVALEKCNKLNSALNEESREYKGLADELEGEQNSLSQELQYTQEQLASMTRQMQAASDDYGVWFRVQIGAYQDRSIDKDLETTEGMELESNANVQKVSLGRFRKYEDAKRLQNQLKGMGLNDAWIVTYKDGKRVPIESVIKN